MKIGKILTLVGVLVIVFGLIFGGVTIPLYWKQWHLKDDSDWVKTEATIKSVNQEDKAFFTYSPDDITIYKGDTGTYHNSEFSIDKKLDVYYKVDDNATYYVEKSNIFLYVFGGIGGFFSLIGLVTMIIGIGKLVSHRKDIDMLSE